MTDKTCHHCGQDPGQTSRCNNCGSIVYRYATEELEASSTDAINLDPTPSTTPSPATSPSSPAAALPVRRLTAQRNQLDEFRPVEATDPFGDTNKRDSSGARVVLARMILIGVLLGGVISSQFGGWSDSQSAGLPIAPPLGDVDVSSTVREPVLLDAWGDLMRGDCVLWPTPDDVPFLPTVTDCGAQHDAEISAVNPLPDAEWPFGEGDLDLQKDCKDSFPSYVGQQFDVSEWYVGWQAPTEEDWDSGDRSYRCYVYLHGTQNSKRAYQSGT